MPGILAKYSHERKMCMYCVKCGEQLPDESNSCPHCGESYEKMLISNMNEAEDPGKQLGLASMILGLISVASQFLVVFAGLALPAAIAALVCGFVGKNRSAQVGLKNTNAKVGIICGFVGAGIQILIAVSAMLLVALYLVLYIVVMLVCFFLYYFAFLFSVINVVGFGF